MADAKSAVLIYAASETDADQLYLGRFMMGDPYVALLQGRTRLAVLNALEFGRGLRESGYDCIVAQEDLAARACKRLRIERAATADLVAQLVFERGIRELRVPGEFPSALLQALQRRKLKVAVESGLLFPERELKSDSEAAAIREGNRISALGIAAGAAVLKGSRIRGETLVWKGRVVTSELLREEIEIACLRAGGLAANSIAAAGDQACDPHCRGSGPIRPHSLVILDVFPRVHGSGYFGDMTRTFLRGRASDAQRQLIAAVEAAQKAALAKLRAGVTGKAVHASCVAVFERLGFKTTRGSTGAQGFIHGTGHGLGLAIHESPRVNPTGPRLRSGMVVTVEPGLYYPGIGGARIEDVVRIRPKGIEMLSDAPLDWEFS